MDTQRKFTAQDLYRKVNGELRLLPQDIKQDAIGNCYFLAPLQAVAQRHPQHIANMIDFNTEKQEFSVQLYNEKTEKYDLVYKVNQDDIWENIRRKGGSHLDNGDLNAPLWPAIMEIAFVKKKASDQGGLSIDEAYKLIEKGSTNMESLEILTGFKEIFARSRKDFENNTGQEFNEFLKEVNNKDGIALLVVPEHTSNIVAELYPKHSYSVDRAGITLDGVKYIALRNPLNKNRSLPGEQNPVNHEDPGFMAIGLEALLASDGWFLITTPGQKIVPVNAPSAIKTPEAKQQNANDLLHHLMQKLDSPKQTNSLQDFINSLNERSLAPFTQGDTTAKEAAIVPNSVQALQPENTLSSVPRR